VQFEDLALFAIVQPYPKHGQAHAHHHGEDGDHDAHGAQNAASHLRLPLAVDAIDTQGISIRFRLKPNLRPRGIKVGKELMCGTATAPRSDNVIRTSSNCSIAAGGVLPSSVWWSATKTRCSDWR